MLDDKRDIADDLGHEPLAVGTRGVAIALAVLFAVIIGSLLLMAGLKSVLTLTPRSEPTADSAAAPIAPPPGVPEIDENQRGELRRLRRRETQMLTEYAWVNRDAGVVRIPVRRAMEILSSESMSPTEQPNENREDQ